MQNVEFKAELRDLALARSICLHIKAVPIETLSQTDTYYRLADGRLKRRDAAGHPSEYIFYHRDNSARPRLSTFTIYSETEARRQFGSLDLPVWVVVRKTREVFLHINTRIHLDRVEGLGDYLEFEAMVTPEHPVEACRSAVELLRRAFQPVLGEAVSASYSDLIAQEPGATPAAGPPG
ncbi:MAG: class IV adenylate cyclase [Phycisphaeraceae bacterium]|nr:class IV adenylate cyclase [Phycisphaeraceae bacterium]